MGTAPVSGPASRLRRVASGVLGILAVVAILAASLVMTLRVVVLSPDALTTAIVPVGANPQVQAALATRAASGVVDALDIEGRAARLIGGPLGRVLAPAIARTAEDRLADAIGRALASDAFASHWEDVARAAAAGTIAVLRGDSALVTTSGGAIYINVLPAITGTLDALQGQGLIDPSIRLPDLGDPSTPARQLVERLASALGVSLPPDFGQVAIVQTSALARAQDAVATLDAVSLLLVAVAATLAAIAVALAADRWAMAAGIGIGAAVAVAAMPPLLWIAEPALTTAIAVPGMAAAVGVFVGAVLDAVSGTLRGVAAACLGVSLAAMLSGVLGNGVRGSVALVSIAIGAVAFAAGWSLVGPDAALLVLALVLAGAWALDRRAPAAPIP